jgi:hypothetical protein
MVYLNVIKDGSCIASIPCEKFVNNRNRPASFVKDNLDVRVFARIVREDQRYLMGVVAKVLDASTSKILLDIQTAVTLDEKKTSAIDLSPKARKMRMVQMEMVDGNRIVEEYINRDNPDQHSYMAFDPTESYDRRIQFVLRNHSV